MSNEKVLSGAVEISEGQGTGDEGTDENFVFANITPDIINDALKKLKSKNSSGPDKISTKFAKVYHTNYHGSYLSFI